MSHEPSHSTEHLPPPAAQADEHVSSFKVVAIGVTALIVFGAATWWSTRILKGTAGTLNPARLSPTPKEIGKREIGIVDQTPFDVTRAAERYRRNETERLNRYGWVDREKEIIHVPIERAIDDLLAQQPQPGKKP
jgi:hypothetical protein